VSVLRDTESDLALLFSGRLIETEALAHAARVLANEIQARPMSDPQDRDLESLLAIVRMLSRDMGELVAEIQKRA